MTPIAVLARWIANARQFLAAAMETDHLRARLDVDCPHDPLRPCVDCENAHLALRSW